MLARALGGPPYSFTVHGPEEFDKPASPSASARRSGARPSSSRSARSGAASCSAGCRVADWPKVQVVHCGLEPAFHARRAGRVAGGAAAGLRRPAVRAEGPAAAGRGGQRALVAAARPFELVLAGDGEMRAEIEALIARSACARHVRITGWIGSERGARGDPAAARALVLPSFAEGLPVVIMEAMALRRPVITTFVAGIPELVRDGENGWLVPAGDVDALAGAMIDCLAAPADALARMGEAARDRVLARHDVDIEAAKLAGAVRRVQLRARAGGRDGDARCAGTCARLPLLRASRRCCSCRRRAAAAGRSPPLWRGDALDRGAAGSRRAAARARRPDAGARRGGRHRRRPRARAGRSSRRRPPAGRRRQLQRRHRAVAARGRRRGHRAPRQRRGAARAMRSTSACAASTQAPPGRRRDRRRRLHRRAGSARAPRRHARATGRPVQALVPDACAAGRTLEMRIAAFAWIVKNKRAPARRRGASACRAS